MANRGQPPSFKTDVHRAPTKKWADAKSYSYEGDDWGGYDEFGEYGDYDEAPPLPNPTGLRQRGQALPPVDTYQGASSSASTAPPMPKRSNSFEAGDETRSFSAGFVPPLESEDVSSFDPSFNSRTSGATSQGTASSSVNTYSGEYEQSSTQGMRTSGTGVAAYPTSRGIAPPLPQDYSGLSPFDHQSGTADIQNSRAPIPVDSSALPSAATASHDTQAEDWFPPRKSSLTTARPTNLPPIVQLPAREDSLPLPPATDFTPGPSVSTDSSVPKALPFIRPADIYKRMQEEKEKERRSMDSSRSSMESMPRLARDDVRSLGSNPQARESSGSPARVGSALQTVPERKSEYGMEGISVQDSGLGPSDRAETLSKAQPLEEETLSSDSYVPSTEVHGTPATARSEPFLAPSLPQLNRLSGFGSDFWSSPSSEQERSALVTNESSNASTANPMSEASKTTKDDPVLHPQPSLGFRSAVDHAFEPQTPLSGKGSQRSIAGSELSGSNNTTGISPIMSRVPSAATAMRNAQTREEAAATVATPSIITEETSELSSPDSRPASASTLKGPTMMDSAHSRDVSGGSGSGSIMPGLRDDMASPSAMAVSARGMVVQSENSVPEGNTAEIGRITPVPSSTQMPSKAIPEESSLLEPSSQPSNVAFGEADDDEEPKSVSENYPSRTTDSQSALQDITLDTRSIHPVAEVLQVERASGTSSPSKGRVRDLASRYDGYHSSRQNSFDSTSAPHSRPDSPANQAGPRSITNQDFLTEGNFDGSSDAPTGTLAPVNPTDLDLPSGRPQLPGAWVSYTGSELQGHNDESSITRTPVGLEAQSRNTTPTPTPDESEVDLSPSFNNLTDSSMAAVAMAGSAIAESLMSTIGINMNPTDTDSGATDTSMQPGYDRVPEGNERGLDNLTPSPLSAQKTTLDDSPDEDFVNAPVPLSHDYPAAPIDTAAGQLQPDSYSADHMSWESSPEDLESDRLRKDIVRTLKISTGEQNTTASGNTPPISPIAAPPSPNDNLLRQSTAIPREYDSYWASTSNFSRSPGTGGSLASRTSIPTPTQAAPQSPRTLEDTEAIQSSPDSPSQLSKRFSWEQDLNRNEDDHDIDSQANEIPPGALYLSQTPIVAPEEPAEDSNPVPVVATSEREIQSSATEAVPSVVVVDASPIPGPDPHEPSSAYSIPEITFADTDENMTSTRGLTFMEPMSEESNDPTYVSGETAPQNETMRLQTPVDSVGHSSNSTGRAGVRISQAKLAPFKEIMAKSQSPERIEAYNQTREGFAMMHTGLNDWLTYMVSAHPDHAQPAAPPKTTVNTTGLAGSVRTRLSPSAKLMSPGGSQPYYQQYLDSAGPLPTVTTQSPAASSSLGQMDTGPKSRTTSGQAQGKGKELLHSAGVFGGKASTGAKGLFAKGKSKFRTASTSEKDLSSTTAAATSHDKKSGAPQLPHVAHTVHYSQSGTTDTGGPSVSEHNAGLAKDSQQYNTTSQSDRSVVDTPTFRWTEAVPNSNSRSIVGEPQEQAMEDTNWYYDTDRFTPGLALSPETSYPIATLISAESVPTGTEPRSLETQDIETPVRTPEAMPVDENVASPNRALPLEPPQDSLHPSHESFHSAREGSPSQSHREGTTTPGSEVGAFGARGMLLWEDTSPEAFFHGFPPSLLQSPEVQDPATRRTEIDARTDQLQSSNILPPTQDSRTLPQVSDSRENHLYDQAATMYPVTQAGLQSLPITDHRTVESSSYEQGHEREQSHVLENGDDLEHSREVEQNPQLEQDREPDYRSSINDDSTPPIGLLARKNVPTTNAAKFNQTESDTVLSRESKEFAIEPTEVHPAMRDDRSSTSSILEQRPEHTRTYSGPGPAVDIKKLPPTVRKQYTQSMPAGAQKSNSSEISSIEHDSTSATASRRHTYDPSRSVLQNTGSSTPQRPYDSNVSLRDTSRGVGAPLSQPRANDIEYHIPGLGPPVEHTTTSAKRRSMSPWRRFRARKSDPSQEPTPLAKGTLATDSPYLDGTTRQEEEPATPKRTSRSPWRSYRSRSRAASVHKEEKAITPSGAIADSEAVPFKRLSWMKLRKGSRGNEGNPQTPDVPALPSPTPNNIQTEKERDFSPTSQLTWASPQLQIVSEPETLSDDKEQPVQDEEPGNFTTSSSVYSLHGLGNSTSPIEQENMQTKEVEANNNARKAVPAPVQAAAATLQTGKPDVKKRRSWFGSLLGSSNTETDEPRRSKRLSKAQTKRSQINDSATQTKTKHWVEQHRSEAQQARPRDNNSQWPLDTNSHHPENVARNGKSEDVSTSTGVQGNSDLDQSRELPNRAIHVQYLQKQGLYPPRATSDAQCPDIPSKNGPGQRAFSQWPNAGLEPHSPSAEPQSPNTFPRTRHPSQPSSSSVVRKTNASSKTNPSILSKSQAQRERAFAPLPAPPPFQYHPEANGARQAPRTMTDSSTQTDLEQPEPPSQTPPSPQLASPSSGPPIPYVPFLSQASSSTGHKKQQSTSPVLDWQPPTDHPIIQGEWKSTTQQDSLHKPNTSSMHRFLSFGGPGNGEHRRGDQRSVSAPSSQQTPSSTGADTDEGRGSNNIMAFTVYPEV